MHLSSHVARHNLNIVGNAVLWNIFTAEEQRKRLLTVYGVYKLARITTTTKLETGISVNHQIYTYRTNNFKKHFFIAKNMLWLDYYQFMAPAKKIAPSAITYYNDPIVLTALLSTLHYHSRRLFMFTFNTLSLLMSDTLKFCWTEAAKISSKLVDISCIVLSGNDQSQTGQLKVKEFMNITAVNEWVSRRQNLKELYLLAFALRKFDNMPLNNFGEVKIV